MDEFSLPSHVPPRGERVYVCITTSLVVIGPRCNFAMGKGDEYTKLCVSSETQNSIRYSTF